MKKHIQLLNLKPFAKTLMSFAVLSMLTVACTKSRDPDVKDVELAAELVEINSIQNKEFSIQTGSAIADSSSKMNAGDEKTSAKIKSTNAPASLANIFKDIAVPADQNQNLTVRFVLDKDAMHVMKIVKDDSQLSTIEKQARLVEKGKGSLVPLFNLKVEDFGRLCREKDDNGDETSKLYLCHTDFENATHVRLSLLKNERAGYFKSDEMKEIFLANRIDGKISKLSDLTNQLNVALSPVDDSKVVSYVVPGKGSEVGIQVYKIMKKSDIKDDDMLKALDSNLHLGAIEYCPAEIKKQLSAEEAKDCVLLFAYELKASSVQAEVKTKDDIGEPTITVDFKDSDSSKDMSLIRIKEASPVQIINPKDTSQLSAYNTIRIVDLKNKEFFLHRTFEDGASPIQVFGPGASADMDIVKFEFEKDRMVVRRVTTLNGDPNANDFDKEELMSIPVKYLGIDPASRNNKNPNLIQATKDAAQYIVLDWTHNTLPVLNSPLSLYQDGQCFAAAGSESVTALDNRIDKGILNFTIEGAYSFNPQCMSYYNLHDYWSNGVQGSFNIRERVSFKLAKADPSQPDIENPGIDVPFRAQNLLGFGVFTTDKLVPDSFGNSGKVDNEVARPVIHDFRNGYKLVYYLGGLPESGWMRDALIDGTKKVIADWNKGLHRAFAGTALDRSDDYIVLKIDGVDGVEPGHLGDLDRNYIWNYAKNLDSGLLGMSQAAPNPRTGVIEQNSILMYSGNLMAEIGYFREMARYQKEYEDLKKQALAQYSKSEDNSAPSTPSSPGIDPGDENGGLTIENGRQLLQKLNTIAMVRKPFTSALLSNKKKIVTPAILASMPARAKDQIQGRGRSNDISGRKAQVLDSRRDDRLYIERIVRKALELNATKDEVQLNALTAAEILRTYGKSNLLTQTEKNALAAQYRRLALMAGFEKNFSKGPNCMFTAQSLGNVGEADPDLLDPNKTPEVFKAWYMSTLLHEMGHSLGLTHNFIGSKDMANFWFPGEKAKTLFDAARTACSKAQDSENADDQKACEEAAKSFVEVKNTSRNYSSIMDYIPDTNLRYDGPGPYDIRALRVAYTGLIELSDSAQSQKLANTKVYNVSPDFKNEITLSDFKKLVLPQGTWWDLDGTFFAKVPVKYYQYCTDVHVGGAPDCNRWDVGTSDAEIAQYYADEYRELYPLMNNRGAKINLRGLDSYISRVITEFSSLRPFLEETYYKLIQGADYQSTLQAAVTARDLFVEVVNTPSTNLPYYSLGRFQPAELPIYDDQGQDTGKTKVVLVEAKPTSDISAPGTEDTEERIDTRGIELDKVLAMMMLTQKGSGNPRYEKYSLRVSFPDLEMAMGAQPEQSLTLITLGNILSDNPMALVQTDQGLQPLPPEFQTDITSMIQYYATVSASVFLDADTIEDKYNASALFRVANSRAVPKDRLSVVKLDQNAASSGSMKYWALDNANYAQAMIQDLAQKRVYLDNADKLAGLMVQGLTSEGTNNPDTIAKIQAQAVKLLNDMNKKGLIISPADARAGVTPEKIFEMSLKFMNIQVQQASEMLAELRKRGLNDDQIGMLIPRLTRDMAKQVTAMTKRVPVLAIAQKGLLKLIPADGKGQQGLDPLLGAALASFLDANTLEVNYGITASNLELLNQIMTAMHPELTNN